VFGLRRHKNPQIPKHLFEIHQHSAERRDEGDQYGGHFDGVADVPDEGFDFVAELRVARQNFCLQFLAAEHVLCAKLHAVAHQDAVGFHDFGPKIHVDEQHGQKQTDDDGYEKSVHGRKGNAGRALEGRDVFDPEGYGQRIMHLNLRVPRSLRNGGILRSGFGTKTPKHKNT
jgi:hypothetical protein